MALGKLEMDEGRSTRRKGSGVNLSLIDSLRSREGDLLLPCLKSSHYSFLFLSFFSVFFKLQASSSSAKVYLYLYNRFVT